MKYERLTQKYPNGGVACFKKCITCPTPACDICKFNDEKNTAILERLAELEDMIEDGRMLESPCKVGDEVYIVAKQGLDIYSVEKTVVCDLWFSAGDNCLYPIDKSGVPLLNIFHTRAEAEKKLKELKGD